MHAALFLILAAQAPPPPPAALEPPATAWACTKKTLVADLPCTVEGKTLAQPASKDLSKENQRQAKVFAEDLCNTLAQSGGPDGDAGVLAVCLARVPRAIKRCGGDGSRRILDDAGRFNPGHAGCYSALAELARDTAALVDSASACCACVHDSCSANEEQCVARMADDKAPEVSSACLDGVCATSCAQAKLFGGKR